MADESPRSELALLAGDELATYFEHLAGRVEDAGAVFPPGRSGRSPSRSATASGTWSCT